MKRFVMKKKNGFTLNNLIILIISMFLILSTASCVEITQFIDVPTSELSKVRQCGFVNIWATNPENSLLLWIKSLNIDPLEIGVMQSYNINLPSDMIDIELQTGSNLTVNFCTDALVPDDDPNSPSVDDKYMPISGTISVKLILDKTKTYDAWILNSGRVEIVLDQVVFSNNIQLYSLESFIFSEMAVFDNMLPLYIPDWP